MSNKKLNLKEKKRKEKKRKEKKRKRNLAEGGVEAGGKFVEGLGFSGVWPKPGGGWCRSGRQVCRGCRRCAL
jgi:hypothetical protein